MPKRPAWVSQGIQFLFYALLAFLVWHAFVGPLRKERDMHLHPARTAGTFVRFSSGESFTYSYVVDGKHYESRADGPISFNRDSTLTVHYSTANPENSTVGNPLWFTFKTAWSITGMGLSILVLMMLGSLVPPSWRRQKQSTPP